MWTKKFKGSRERGGAYIFTHPLSTRAIVYNCYGYSYDGIKYPTLEEAKEAAEKNFKKDVDMETQ